ncbi:hypothetical protein ACFSTA_03605 [Ornithinibacillus salinisoli]|uniref:DUF2273 domain-containing protein n=1 Tax=Ornithinibacillus salinisoli TaxID=1848459 RepID=A0ABW4VUT8_9BACI
MSKMIKAIIGFIIGGLVGFLLFGDRGIGIEIEKLIFAVVGAGIALYLDNLKNR